MNFVLPPKSQVGYLDPEIAGEGTKIIHSDGEIVNWAPPPVKPIIPDLSQVKSIRHYFGRTGGKTYPAWFYHEKEAPRLLKSADEAAQLGIVRREATVHERGTYGVSAVWDYAPECEWRAAPFERDTKFNPDQVTNAKTVIRQENRSQNENAMIERMIPQVAAAVAAALRVAQPTAPTGAPTSDPELWAQFQEFVAFKKAAEVAAADPQANAFAAPRDGDPVTETLGADDDEEFQRAELQATAIRLGIKIDKRWGLARLSEAINVADAERTSKVA